MNCLIENKIHKNHSTFARAVLNDCKQVLIWFGGLSEEVYWCFNMTCWILDFILGTYSMFKHGCLKPFLTIDGEDASQVKN